MDFHFFNGSPGRIPFRPFFATHPPVLHFNLSERQQKSKKAEKNFLFCPGEV
jgi:hypothetical protein